MANETLTQWGNLTGKMGVRLIEAIEVDGDNANWLRSKANMNLAIEILRNQYARIEAYGSGKTYPLTEKQVAVVQDAIARADEYLNVWVKSFDISH